MENHNGSTGDLIRSLSRRQWAVSLAVVALTLGGLLLGWEGHVSNEQTAEMVNLAGRQRMLSQRMAMFLVLHDRESDPGAQRQYLDMARAAATEFDQAHARLAANATRLGRQSPIHAAYFGPAARVDAESKHYLGLVRNATEALAQGRPADARATTRIIAEASNGLIRDLHEVTTLYQRSAEEWVALMLKLTLVAALLIVVLVAFGMVRVFRPLILRLERDVAGREQAQRDLKDSEERFRAFSESSSDWFWESDREHRFAWIRDGQSVNTPLSHDKVIGRTRLELRPTIEIAATEKWHAYQADLNARRPFRDLEYQIGSDEQGLRWISVNGQPFFDDEGQFLGYRGTARYIQARKDIEASLERLQLAIEQSPVSIMITDARAVILYVNANFSAVSGYAAKEAIGRTPKILWSGQTPEPVFTDMRKTLGEGRIWRGEICNRKKSGELYWEKQSISPVRGHLGETSHYIAVNEDVTAMRALDRRERNRHAILEAIAGGMPLPGPLELMVNMAEAELPGGICTIQRLDRVQGRLFNACSSQLSASYKAAVDGIAIGIGVGSCGTAAATATRIVVEDVSTHSYWQDYRELAATEGIRACWSQPILSSAGLVLGTVAIYYRTPRAPAADEIQVIELVSSLAAICLERDEAEQNLRHQEAQARRLLAEHETIFSNALVGIVYLKHRRIVSCNRRLEEIFGYAPGELIGESTEVFYDTHQSFEEIGNVAYRVATQSRNFSTELMLKHKDGSLFRGALTGRVIDPAYPQEGSIWVYADISERYKAEQQARKLLRAVEQSPVSIVITNRDGIIEYVNPRFSKVTGYAAEEAVGQNPRILRSGQTSPEVYQDLWRTLLDGRIWTGVMLNRRKNGDTFWEEASISPIIDDAGIMTHFIAVKEDISDRKRIADELDQHRAHLEDLVEQRTADLMTALEAAKAADVAKDAFLANVSHELRTPLNAVIGLTELARRISADPRQQDYLDKATGAGKTLASIINDLLDLSKISAGQMELEETAFSLRALVQRSRSVMAHRATEKGLELLESIADEVPDVLQGDPLRIEQILLNLLSNAIKFTPAGRVMLRIGLDRREDGRVRLGIEVEDTGIGLSAENIPRLFQPFVQADPSMNRKFGGTGLGLALCKRLAEMMDGDIRISSREGVGTTFHVCIWLKPGEVSDLPDATHAAPQVTLPERYRGTRVLVVDDQPLNREIVEVLLEQVGITAQVAANGAEALAALDASGTQAFDLVLMDIQMPIMDGLAATRAIRSRPKYSQLPVIAMTAHTMEHEKEVSIAAGMNDHIGKPFETENFFRLLARWIPAAKQQSALPPQSVATPIAAPAVGLAALHSIDTQAGLARFVGNEARYRHWLGEFLRDAPDYAPQIRGILAEGEREAARQAAHAIKGRVGMLGMTGLHPIATALEAALMQGAPTDELLDRMEAAVAALCEEIRNALGAGQPANATATEAAARPRGPLSESLANVVVMLQCADGGSVEAIERCLFEMRDTEWGPRLQQALTLARAFDFDAARRLITGDDVSANMDGTA